ncbi:MAG: queuine tRNA-ribosyltransferase family protein [archaeon GB-1867-005]|nr:queuine tRNA-ribosyltransferase family protein [Candidatus Culexmicrobium cathedralense]
MKYLLPDWHDIVDGGFDFKEERHSDGFIEDKFRFGARLWHILGEIPFEGVLVSRSVLELKHIVRRVEELGVKSFLRLPGHAEVMGDCGAWQYVRQITPPYDPVEMLTFYSRIGVDLGVTVDHIAILGTSAEDQLWRMRITYENALKMLDEWRRNFKEKFLLLAAVQGINSNDYVKFVKALYSKGFDSFALGGLARRSSVFIKKLIKKLRGELHGVKLRRLHFLGVARLKLIPLFQELEGSIAETVSFDSSTVLRIAWLRHFSNYITLDGKAYTAIRVWKESKLEKELLDALHRYDEGAMNFRELWRLVEEYVYLNGGVDYLPYYYELLINRPWKKCKCKICREIGIDVVIFRGNDRNRRRGFHNVWVFSNFLKEKKLVNFRIAKSRHLKLDLTKLLDLNPWIPTKLKNILVITNCTAQKNVEWRKIDEKLRSYGLSKPKFDIENEGLYRKLLSEFILKAEDMYAGNFRVVKRGVNKLRSKGVKVDVVFISARYGVIHGQDRIIPYDATFSGKSSDWIRKWASKHNVEEKILSYVKDDYDLIIVNLSKAYLLAAEEAVNKLLMDDRAVIVAPITKAYHNHDIRATVFPVKGVRNQTLLIKHIFDMLNLHFKAKNPTLLNWIGFKKSTQ